MRMRLPLFIAIAPAHVGPEVRRVDHGNTERMSIITTGFITLTPTL